jgi:hypothetical protein
MAASVSGLRELIPAWIVDLNIVDEPIPDDVVLEDGSELARQAWEMLHTERDALNLPDLQIYPLAEFVRRFPFEPLSVEQKTAILDQAVLLFRHLYPHLAFKQQQFSFAEPIQRLGELRKKLAAVTEGEFHSAMIGACNSVVDTHTIYGVPPPYGGAVAFLPFQLRAYRDEHGCNRFAVTRLMKTREDGSFGHPLFAPGACITHLNWFAAQFYIQESPDRFPSGNPVCRAARGAMSATLRPLAFCPLPAMTPLEGMSSGEAQEWPFGEETTTVHYHPPGSSEHKAIRFPWAVATGLGNSNSIPTSAFSVSAPYTAAASMRGILVRRDRIREQHKIEMGLGPSPFLVAPKPANAAPPQIDLTRVSKIPSVFAFQYTEGGPGVGVPPPEMLRDESRPDARFGYIKIRSFTGGGAGTAEIVSEFRRILTLMNDRAPDGLVLDIRGNPGGDIQAAESMPQMLTDRRITPAFFHLANSPVLVAMLRWLGDNTRDKSSMTVQQEAALPGALLEFEPWIQDVDESVKFEGPLTKGHHLTPVEDANRIGRVYRGPSVLVTDVGTYSAADMFAAAYQDHEIGLVIGVDPATGGGGGNVWTHENLLRTLPAFPDLHLEKLPGGATLTLAIRRATRPNTGVALEDAGVAADLHFPPDSAGSLLDGFPGVIRHGCRLLGAGRNFRLRITDAASDGGAIHVQLALENVDAVSFLVNSKPALSTTAGTAAAASFTVPLDSSVLADGDPDSVILSAMGFASLRGTGGIDQVLVATADRVVRQPSSDAVGD